LSIISIENFKLHSNDSELRVDTVIILPNAYSFKFVRYFNRRDDYVSKALKFNSFASDIWRQNNCKANIFQTIAIMSLYCVTLNDIIENLNKSTKTEVLDHI
jgi:hypothetical protein